MATDSARVNLELASGRSENTAPIDRTQTAQRRRKQQIEEAAIAPPPPPSAEPQPVAAPVMINVPLSGAAPMPLPDDSEVPRQDRQARPTWIVFVGALIAVAVAVWWVMSQRMPDIDPREVIQRNLADARLAMADGRYTDPSERSALHYFSTVLSLDPRNADALAGIDEIADRHITNARVLLANRHIAEAGVAIEKARRVRPDHSALPELDTQLRTELRKLLLATNVSVPPQPVEAPPAPKQTSRTAPRDQPVVPRALPALAANRDVPPATTMPYQTRSHSYPPAATPAPSEEAGSAPLITAPAESTNAATPLPESTPPTPVPSVEPKIVKMVQPVYPQEALMRGFEGWVDVSLEVNAEGDVVAPRVEATSRGRIFNRSALNAIQQWKYEPRGDGAGSDRIHVRLQFKLAK